MDRLPTPLFLGFPCGSAGKESACNAGDLGSIRGLGRSPGEGKGNPLQYSGMENSMDLYSPRGHKESDTTERLSVFTFKSALPFPRWEIILWLWHKTATWERKKRLWIWRPFLAKPASALFFCEPATVGTLQECKVSLFVPSALHLPASQAGNRAASHRPRE